MYSDTPRPAYKGLHPGRAPKTRGGVWSDKALQDIESKNLSASIGSLYSDLDSLGECPFSHPTPVSPAPGSAYSWEGVAGTMNTANGNKLTSLPLVSWKVKGAQTLDFTLYHNNESNYDVELGHHWTWSYDI